MKRHGILMIAALATVAAVILAAPGTAGAQACPQVYEPVCAVTPGGTRSVFGNRCLAAAARARVLNAGACEQRVCMELYMPVCAVNPQTRRPETYSNKCFADAAKARLVAEGPCR
jgi:hypothetical protein